MDYKKKYLKYKLKYLNAKKLYGGMQSPPPNFQDEILLPDEQIEQDLNNYFDGGSLDEEFRLVLTEANNKKRFLDIENPQVRELKEMLGEKFYNASVDDYLEKKDIDVRFDEFYEDTISLIEKREDTLNLKGIDYEQLKTEFLKNKFDKRSLFEFITDLERKHGIVVN